MREPLRDRSRLEHILGAIERLQTHAGQLSREEIVELKEHIIRYLSETNWDEWAK